MGLAMKVGKRTFILAHLTPLKEKELLVVGPAFDAEFTHAFYIALHTLLHELGVTSFNCCVYMPRMGAGSSTVVGSSAVGAAGAIAAGRGYTEPLLQEPSSSAPNMSHVCARLVDRGNAAMSTTDMASMELYGGSIVNTDPCKVARAVERALSASTLVQDGVGRVGGDAIDVLVDDAGATDGSTACATGTAGGAIDDHVIRRGCSPRSIQFQSFLLASISVAVLLRMVR
jgi:hypothetical protein